MSSDVEQRPVDQDVDLVQPVLQHRDADGDRQRGDGERVDRGAEHARRRSRTTPGQRDEQPEGEPADLLADQRRSRAASAPATETRPATRQATPSATTTSAAPLGERLQGRRAGRAGCRSPAGGRRRAPAGASITTTNSARSTAASRSHQRARPVAPSGKTSGRTTARTSQPRPRTVNATARQRGRGGVVGAVGERATSSSTGSDARPHSRRRRRAAPGRPAGAGGW